MCKVNKIFPIMMFKTLKNAVETHVKSNKKLIWKLCDIFISRTKLNLSRESYIYLLKSYYRQLTGLLTTCGKM